MLTGLEVAAAVGTIVNVFVGCAKLVAEYKKKRKKDSNIRTGNESPDEAERLHRALCGGRSAVDEEFNRQRAFRGSVMGIGDRMYADLRAIIRLTLRLLERARNGLWLAWSLLEVLKAQLHLLEQDNNGLIRIEFATLRDMAQRSRLLAVTSIQELAQRLGSANAGSGLLSNTNLMASQLSLSSSTRSHNVHNICENALLYRENQYSFDNAAMEAGREGRMQVWVCRRCNMKLFRARRQISSSNSDVIWVGPGAQMKSHCSFQQGQPEGWTCIWQKVSRQCYLRFESRERLLKHMLDVHVGERVLGQATTVDWPEDLRPRMADQCGFGVTIGGCKMQDSGSSFIVPGSD
jgi:hypothetical protein